MLSYTMFDRFTSSDDSAEGDIELPANGWVDNSRIASTTSAFSRP